MLPEKLVELRIANYDASCVYHGVTLAYVRAMAHQAPPEHLRQLRAACNEAAIIWLTRIAILQSHLLIYPELDVNKETTSRLERTVELITRDLANLNKDKESRDGRGDWRLLQTPVQKA